MKVINKNSKGEVINLSNVTLSKEVSLEILKLMKGMKQRD